MKITKNKKRIDPRYFLNETAMGPRQGGEELQLLVDEAILIYCGRRDRLRSTDQGCEDFASCLLSKIIDDVKLSDPIHRGGGPWTTETLLEEMGRVIKERGTHAVNCSAGWDAEV